MHVNKSHLRGLQSAMRLTLFGSRVHITSVHGIKLLKIVVVCIVALSVVSFVLSFFTVPYVSDNDNSHFVNKKYGYNILASNPNRGRPGGIRRSLNESQAQLDYIASNLDISIRPIANEMGRFFYNVILTNSGDQVINRCCWTIYLYSSKMLDCVAISTNTGLMTSEESRLTAKYNGNRGWSDDPITSEGEGSHDEGFHFFDTSLSFIVSHAIGYTFKMKPNYNFRSIQPKSSIVVRFVGYGWSVSKSEFIPNWYVANDLDPSVLSRSLRSTASEDLNFVGDFDRKSSVRRYENDFFRPFSPKERYSKNAVANVHLRKVTILPTPLYLKVHDLQQTTLTRDWQILYSAGLGNEAQYLNEKLGLKTRPMERALGSSDNSTIRDSIVLRLLVDEARQRLTNSVERHATTKKVDFGHLHVMEDAYEMNVLPNSVTLSGLSSSGIFYAAVSLLNCLDDGLTTPDGVTSFVTQSFSVVDVPRFEHRGLMVDVSRNFQPIEEIKKVVEAMVVYKMNVLHLHLSDDEGWRLEVPGLPELTRVGGHRGHDPKEREMLMSLLGSGPLEDSNSGSGYYSVEDYREFLKFASKRHVTVVPEFDMPSHSHAAIVSMKARHAANKQSSTQRKDFLLSDLFDRSSYLTGQFYSSSAINPCLKSTYRFVHHLLRFLISVYKDVAPLKYFHLGGDEVPKDAYQESPSCQDLQSSFLQKIGLNFGGTSHNLKTYFVENVARMAARYNLTLIGWDDAFLHDDGSLMSIKKNKAKNSANKNTNPGGDVEVVAQYYYNVWEQGLAAKPYIMANKGMKVILSPATNLYFDSPQEPDPDDWGLHWASRYTDTKRTFHFTPDNLYNSIDFTFDGEQINKQFVCSQHPCQSLRKPENILGIEAAMWSELIRTPERMHSMLFPRLLAVAERAWHRAAWENEEDDDARLKRRRKDWERFATTVGQRELKRLERLGISYYLPRPGAVVQDNRLKTNTMFPGLKVQVSRDSGHTWTDADDEDSLNPNEESSISLSTLSFDGKRRSVPVKLRAIGSDGRT